MKNKTHLLPLASLLLAGGILCTGCGGDAPASSVPADVSTASSVEEVDAMDGYDYINDYVGLWGYYDIEFFFSTDWNMSSTSDDKIFTKSYVVYLPEDYDGLVFAAQAQPDNYADAMALDNLENASPEGNIMDLSPLDPYASLYFSICG